MKNFWIKKKILITGATGFIGGHLVSRLVKLGAEITILNDRKISSFSTSVNKKLKKKIIGDVSQTRFVYDIFKKTPFDLCFHLAAQPLVETAEADPTPTFEVNIKGTWNILEAARKYKTSVIIASTSHVYGANTLPFLEEYFPRPSRPYETSKACADILAQTYATYYKLPVAIARFVNVYGPGDTNMRIIPYNVSRILKGKRPTIYADETTRDYMYIDDAIDGYIALAERMKLLKEKTDNIIFNFGNGNHHSTRQIIEKIIELSGLSDIEPEVVDYKRKQEISKQYVSIKKAKEILQWEPRHTLTEGLQKTIEWHKTLKR